MNNNDYTTRPTGKPAESIRGRLIRWKDSDYIEFQPQCKKDGATRSMIRETKNLSYYRNEGQKESSYSLHVNVSGDTADPANALLEKVQKELAPLTKKEPRLANNVRYLCDVQGLKVWHRKKDKTLCVMIELDTSKPSFLSNTLIRQMSEVNKIINSNQF